MDVRTLRGRACAIFLVVVLCLGASLAWPPSQAEADPVTSAAAAAAKFLANSLFRSLASEIYKNDCTRIGEPSKTDFICGALGSFSGAAEKAWKVQIEARLESLGQSLGALQDGQEALGRQIAELNRQNRALFHRIDQVGPEASVQETLDNIDITWEYSFLPLFEDRESFERNAILDLAEYLVATDLPHQIAGMSRTLTRSGLSQRDSLIDLWAGSLHADLGPNAGDADLRAAYARLEFEMSRLIFRQRQGLIMHRWAQEVLESECELNEDSPHCGSRSRWREGPLANLELRTLRDQLGSFSRSVDFLVLGQSDPHSNRANFLPAAAEEIFRRADLFTASNLNQPGLRGRVISMGDRFDGGLKIETSSFDARSSDNVRTAKGPLDWWTGTRGEFDEVHFANHWTVFRYHLPDFGIRADVPWGADLPFDSGPITSVRIDLSTGEPATGNTDSPTLEFGSFLGIQRAGGGYALLSGQWDEGSLLSRHGSDTSANLGSSNSGSSSGVEPVEASVAWTARANRNAGGRHRYHGSLLQTVVSRKRVAYAGGGEVRLTNDDGYLTARTFSASGRVAVVFGTWDSSNGVALSRSQGRGSDQIQRTELTWTEPESAMVELATPQPITLSTQVTYDVSPAAYAFTSWYLIARARVANAYLTKP